MRIPGPAVVAALFVLSSLAFLGGGHAVTGLSPSSDSNAPHTGVPASHAIPAAPAAAAHAAPSSPAARNTPSASCVPNWNSVNFFNDVCVSFGQVGASTPPNLPIVPFVGNVSMYVPAVWINVTTNVPITAANVFIWGTQWQQNGTPAQSPPGFDPSGWNTTDVHPMELCNAKHAHCATPSPDSATYALNLNKYFFPGSNVSFMIEVISASGTPTSTIWSYKTTNVTEPYPSGYVTYPTWEFVVDSPFASPVFENDIKITTIPSVLTQPAFFPNPTQKVQIVISSFSITGGALAPIPVAYAQYSINTKLQGGGTSSSTGSAYFTPPNATVAALGLPIQPEPGGTYIVFNITAGLLWQGSNLIDKIVSKDYRFAFITGGSWPQPASSLESNANLTSIPFVIHPGITYLPTGTPVNVTVHEAIENVSITASEVDFTFTDHSKSLSGSVPMTLISQNTSSVTLPGLPPDSSLNFQVITKDVNGNPVFSSRYNYVENGTPVPAPSDTKGYFFVEVYDVAKHTLVSGVPFTMANLTWVQNSTTTPFGFGSILTFGTNQFLQLSDGDYILSIHVFGTTIDRKVTVSAPMPFTVIYYVSSTLYPLPTSSPAPATLALAGVIGLAGAFVAYLPLMGWFKERRAKAEEEQRRITL